MRRGKWSDRGKIGKKFKHKPRHSPWEVGTKILLRLRVTSDVTCKFKIFISGQKHSFDYLSCGRNILVIVQQIP